MQKYKQNKLQLSNIVNTIDDKKENRGMYPFTNSVGLDLELVKEH